MAFVDQSWAGRVDNSLRSISRSRQCLPWLPNDLAALNRASAPGEVPRCVHILKDS
jgi:hypothetical protein